MICTSVCALVYSISWPRTCAPPFTLRVYGLAYVYFLSFFFAHSPSGPHFFFVFLRDALENLLLLLVSTPACIFYPRTHEFIPLNMRAVCIWLGRRVSKCVPRSVIMLPCLQTLVSYRLCHTSPRPPFGTLYKDVFRARKYVVVQKYQQIFAAVVADLASRSLVHILGLVWWLCLTDDSELRSSIRRCVKIADTAAI